MIIVVLGRKSSSKNLLLWEIYACSNCQRYWKNPHDLSFWHMGWTDQWKLVMHWHWSNRPGLEQWAATAAIFKSGMGVPVTRTHGVHDMFYIYSFLCISSDSHTKHMHEGQLISTLCVGRMWSAGTVNTAPCFIIMLEVHFFFFALLSFEHGWQSVVHDLSLSYIPISIHYCVSSLQVLDNLAHDLVYRKTLTSDWNETWVTESAPGYE
jgi:hypothetical protein